MFSIRQKREIADAVQKILRATHHPELPTGQIQFVLHVDGAESESWADIKNNGAVTNPRMNPWTEKQDRETGAHPGASPLGSVPSVERTSHPPR